MFDVVSIVDPGYKTPSYNELRGHIIQNKKVDCTTRLEEFKASWKNTGCILMLDGWANHKGMTLVNFLVSYPKGTMFMKFIDAFAHNKDVQSLCELLGIFIQGLRPHNVLQVITCNATNYVLISI